MSRLKNIVAERAIVVAALLIGLVLAACSPSGLLEGPGTGGTAGPASGEVLGAGTTKVTMLLPLSATGGPGQLAKDMRNAAEMALREFPSAGIQIQIRDDLGTADGARVAATAAVTEGTQLIIGPVFSQAVAATAAVARPAKVPVIAFSNDTATAARGVYLISFLPQSDVERIIRYSSSQGKKSFAALVPANAYGAVIEASLQRAAANAGGRVVTLQKYNSDRASIEAKAKAVADVVRQGTVNAVLIPEGGNTAPLLAQLLAANGAGPSQVKYLGSGQWDNDPRITQEANLKGGWFPSPDLNGYRQFAERYKAAYGREPARNASLAYDAVSLAAGLTARFGAEAFTEKVLTTPAGFTGVDGAFRFKSNGLNQRALAVYQIETNQLGVLSPPPKNFSGF